MSQIILSTRGASFGDASGMPYASVAPAPIALLPIMAGVLAGAGVGYVKGAKTSAVGALVGGVLGYIIARRMQPSAQPYQASTPMPPVNYGGRDTNVVLDGGSSGQSTPSSSAPQSYFDPVTGAPIDPSVAAAILAANAAAAKKTADDAAAHALTDATNADLAAKAAQADADAKAAQVASDAAAKAAKDKATYDAWLLEHNAEVKAEYDQAILARAGSKSDYAAHTPHAPTMIENTDDAHLSHSAGSGRTLTPVMVGDQQIQQVAQRSAPSMAKQAYTIAAKPVLQLHATQALIDMAQQRATGKVSENVGRLFRQNPQQILTNNIGRPATKH